MPDPKEAPTDGRDPLLFEEIQGTDPLFVEPTISGGDKPRAKTERAAPPPPKAPKPATAG